MSRAGRQREESGGQVGQHSAARAYDTIVLASNCRSALAARPNLLLLRVRGGREERQDRAGVGDIG